MRKRDERKRADEGSAIYFNIPAFPPPPLSPRCHHVVTASHSRELLWKWVWKRAAAMTTTWALLG